MKNKNIGTIFIVIWALSSPAWGQQLTLNNPGFDAQTFADGAWSAPADITGWDADGYSHAQNLAAASITPEAQSGDNTCGLNEAEATTCWISQVPQDNGSAVLVEANNTYTISVWVGRRNGTEGTYGGLLSVYLGESQTFTQLAADTYDLENQAQGTWTFQTFVLSTGSNPAGQGSELIVGFENAGDRAPAGSWWHAQIVLDDVTVEKGSLDGPELIYPVGEENVADYTPTLRWADPENYEPGVYYIYLDPNQANVTAVSKMVEPDPGSPLLVNASQLGSEPNEYTVTTELAHGERFYWKVEAQKTYPGPGEDPNYFSSAVVSFTTMPDEPQIQEHPASQTVPKYSDAVFTIQALNAEEYHWYKVQAGNDVEVGEPNIPTLTITNVQKVDEGYYYCVVSNPSADVPSNTARLMVQRRVAWWNFDSQSINSDIEHPADPNEDFFTGTYFDPNDSSPDKDFNNTAPSPAGGYYIVFSGDTVESEGDNYGEAILVEPNEFFNFYPLGLTASAWVKSNGPDSWRTVVSKTDRYQTLSYPVGWALLQYPAYLNYAMGLSTRQTIGDWGDIIGTTNITEDNEDLDPVDAWHLVTGTYDGSVSRIYVDGNLESTSASSTVVMDTNIQPLVIGAEVADGYGPWDGQIDGVEIYNYALSRYDVAKLYTDQVPGAEVCMDDMSDTDMDFNDDCIVDMKDLANFAADWLNCAIVPTCVP